MSERPADCGCGHIECPGQWSGGCPLPSAPRADLDELGRLLAEATPAGDWRSVEGDLEGGTLNDYIATLLTNRQNDATTTGRLFMTLAPNDIDPERGAEVVPALTGDGPRAEANATLIAALVNAAPALLAEVAELRETVARVNALAEDLWCHEPSRYMNEALHRVACPSCCHSRRLTAALDGAQ